MEESRALIQLEALTNLEKSCRDRLRMAPDDTQARSSLAWCLFMQAVHQSGEARSLAIINELANTANAVDERDMASRHANLARDANQTLRDCLVQSVALVQLSSDEDKLSEISKLYELVRLSGGEDVLLEAEAEADRIVSEMTRDILAGSGMALSSPLSTPLSTQAAHRPRSPHAASKRRSRPIQ